MTDKKDELSEILARTRAAREAAGTGAEAAEQAKKSGNIISETRAVQEAAKNINAFARISSRIGKGIYKAGKPVFDLGRLGVRGYMKLWKAVCTKTDKETGEKKTVKWRAYTMSALSIFAATGVLPAPYGSPAREVIYTPITDSIGMAVNFKSNETLYLTNAEEIGGEANEFGVRGCRTMDCTGTGVNFRVRQSFAHNVWSVLARGTPFYVSDVEVNEIAPGMNRCEVTSYGFRSRFFQMLDMYPTMLTAKCTPVFNQNAPVAAAPAATPASAVNVSASARFTS